MPENDWKTIRVPEEAYQEAKQQKKDNDRTWGEQLTCGDTATTEVVETADIVETMQQLPTEDMHSDEFAKEVAQRMDYAEIANRVAQDVAQELRR